VSTEDQMSIEDRVRAATRAGANLIRDVRPLAAPAPVSLRHRPEPAPRRWLSWGVPLAAAAAVVAIAVSLVAVRQPGTPASSGSQSATASATVPRYYAALDYDANGDTYTRPLIVGDDLTGKVIDTVSPPPGLQFANVQGTSDDRTFVVTADGQTTAPGTQPYTWYLLRIAPETARPFQLIKLPTKLPANSPAIAYALSPDGRELAVESQLSASSTGEDITLGIYSVSSGAELRAWTTRTKSAAAPATSTLSWLPGGRQLVFSVGQFGTGSAYSLQLRALDVTGAGTDMMAASRALLTVANSGPSTCLSLHITPDGRTAVCATQYAFVVGSGSNAGCANGGLKFTAYSVRTGKPVRVLYQYRGACHNGLAVLLWTDDSARYIIGATEINVANQGGKQAAQLGVISNGHIRLLEISKRVPQGDYGTLAF
jgi:hypothetical protein